MLNKAKFLKELGESNFNLIDLSKNTKKTNGGYWFYFSSLIIKSKEIKKHIILLESILNQYQKSNIQNHLIEFPYLTFKKYLQNIIEDTLNGSLISDNVYYIKEDNINELKNMLEVYFKNFLSKLYGSTIFRITYTKDHGEFNLSLDWLFFRSNLLNHKTLNKRELKLLTNDLRLFSDKYNKRIKNRIKYNTFMSLVDKKLFIELDSIIKSRL